MTDLFQEKAQDWDNRPLPTQISEGVFRALEAHVSLDPTYTVMDFGAGTGLVATKIAPKIRRLLAVDISPAMLEKLAAKEALQGRVEIYCQDILREPLGRTVDLIVSAMALHHVEDTAGLLAAFFAHLPPGGRIALADLDREDGTFHAAGTQGVFHHGFDRDALTAMLVEAGFGAPTFTTACEVSREQGRYSIFLVVAERPHE